MADSATDFGRNERACNKLIALIRDRLNVPNAQTLVEDGMLGTEFEKAMVYVGEDSERQRLVAAHLRDTCRDLGLSCTNFRMLSHRWGAPYNDFIRYLKERAALERKGRAREDAASG